MKMKRKKNNFDELETAIADATCRMEAAGLPLPHQSRASDKYNTRPTHTEPIQQITGWLRQGKYEYAHNGINFTGEVRCAA